MTTLAMLCALPLAHGCFEEEEPAAHNDDGDGGGGGMEECRAAGSTYIDCILGTRGECEAEGCDLATYEARIADRCAPLQSEMSACGRDEEPAHDCLLEVRRQCAELGLGAEECEALHGMRCYGEDPRPDPCVDMVLEACAARGIAAPECEPLIHETCFAPEPPPPCDEEAECVVRVREHCADAGLPPHECGELVEAHCGCAAAARPHGVRRGDPPRVRRAGDRARGVRGHRA